MPEYIYNCPKELFIDLVRSKIRFLISDALEISSLLKSLFKGFQCIGKPQFVMQKHLIKGPLPICLTKVLNNLINLCVVDFIG
jgi:hypothetical protein